MKRSGKRSSPQAEFYKAKLEQDERHHKELLAQQELFRKDKSLQLEKAQSQQLEQQERFHKDNLEQSEKARNSNESLTLVIILLTGGMLAANMHIAQDSNNSLALTRELISKTIPTLAPVEPRLEATLMDNKEPVLFSKYDISNIWRDNNNMRHNHAVMSFKLVNPGQMDSKEINVFLRGNWTDKDQIYDRVYMENIERFNYTYIQLHLWDERCSDGPDSNCTLEDMPNGTQKVTLETSCNGCNPQETKQEYTVCIWDKISTECDSSAS